MDRRKLTIPEFHAELKAQAVAAGFQDSFHTAVKCPICGTVQSKASFAAAGVDPETAERQIAFSCIGRHTQAGPHKKGTPPGRGCDWTLGGLFSFHALEVMDEEGKPHPRFEIASAEEARELMKHHTPTA